MPGNSAFVVVGAGQARALVVESLRAWGFDGRVVLIGEEPVRLYERPPLSKDYRRSQAAESKGSPLPDISSATRDQVSRENCDAGG